LAGLLILYQYTHFKTKTHRLIPSRFPPVSLFDWAESAEELEQIANLEGLTNDRLITEYGKIYLVAKEDWVSGEGATPLMAAFTHLGQSRFSDGTFGIYYGGDSLQTAVAETKFHRVRFLSASNEPPCLVQMREYIAHVVQPMVDICGDEFKHLLDPNPNSYSTSQDFASQVRAQKEWGLLYPSVREIGAKCLAVFRPPALTIPVQGRNLDYIWNGTNISEVRISTEFKE
jgi:hypothetical protein